MAMKMTPATAAVKMRMTTTFYSVVCPTCGEEIYLDESLLDKGGIQCPACGEELEFDFGEDEDCGCGCGHDHEGEDKE